MMVVTRTLIAYLEFMVNLENKKHEDEELLKQHKVLVAS